MENNRTAYFDDDQPKLQTSYCLFIDVLGFAQRIEAAFKSGKGREALELYYNTVTPKIRELILPCEQDDNVVVPRAWDAKVFTDNVVLGYAVWSGHGEKEFGNAILQAADYQLHLALDGVFCRGGMTIGPLFMDELTAFGPAILEAYKIESQIADVPRIAISSDVVDLAKRYSKFYAEPAESPENRSVAVDIDGIGFVNYLDELVDGGEVCADSLAKHRDNVMRELVANQKRPKIWAKYRWVAGYHNWFCELTRDLYGFHSDLLISSESVHVAPTFLIPFEE